MNQQMHSPWPLGLDRSRLLSELRQMLEEADAIDAAPVETMTPGEARATSEERLATHWGEKDEVDAIETFTIASGAATIRLRLYRGADTQETMLFFHGGGWVVGSLDTHDGAARALALAARANVLAVEYRKAPEAPFPAAIEDAQAALDWVRSAGAARGLAGDRLILAGDSAGGNIAAVLAIRARDRGIPLAGQILIYPATDLTLATQSFDDYEAGFFLSRATMAWYAAQYLGGGGDPTNPQASPLWAGDLEDLPPTFLVTADHDPLRDEGRAYAQRLIAAGNSVCYEEWRGTIHGFLIMDRTTPAARRLIARIGDWAEDVWATGRQ